MRVIDALLKDSATTTEGVNYFGHAPEPYANVDETEFPRVWVYDTRPLDEVYRNHTVETTYQVLLEISDLVQLDDKTDAFVENLDAMEALWYKFINKLSRDPRNRKPIGKVNRVEILHKFSHGIGGYLCTFNVTVVNFPEYQCD